MHIYMYIRKYVYKNTYVSMCKYTNIVNGGTYVCVNI